MGKQWKRRKTMHAVPPLPFLHHIGTEQMQMIMKCPPTLILYYLNFQINTSTSSTGIIIQKGNAVREAGQSSDT